MSENDAVKKAAREALTFKVVVATWKYILGILAAADIATGVAILLGPPASRSSAAFKLLTQIQLSNSVIAIFMIVSGLLLLSLRTAIFGHFVSAITNGWWSLVIVYIAFFLHQPTSLVVVPWTGALALIHLVAGGARLLMWRFDKALDKIERSPGGSDG